MNYRSPLRSRSTAQHNPQTKQTPKAALGVPGRDHGSQSRSASDRNQSERKIWGEQTYARTIKEWSEEALRRMTDLDLRFAKFIQGGKGSVAGKDKRHKLGIRSWRVMPGFRFCNHEAFIFNLRACLIQWGNRHREAMCRPFRSVGISIITTVRCAKSLVRWSGPSNPQ